MTNLKIYKYFSSELKINTCLVVGDKEEFIKWSNNQSIEELDFEYLKGNSDGTVIEIERKNDFIRVIWIKQFNKKDIYDYGLLVHEITHLVIIALKDKNIPIDYQNQELIAYYIDFFTRTYLNKLLKR